MFVLITGGGRTGTQLARTLLEQDHEVHIVENRPQVLTRLHRELPTEVIYEGNPINPKVLEGAGIQRANVLAACTASDEMNLVQCFIARESYHVHRTIARVNNPRDAWLFNDLFHVDVALNQAGILASLIEEEMSMGDMMTLLKLRRGDYSLVEEKIPQGAKGIGLAIRDMGISNVAIAAIIRKGKIIVPSGQVTFEMGDEVLAVTDAGGASKLAELFSAPSKTS
jgi:trk system potassium uptake protein TrkA